MSKRKKVLLVGSSFSAVPIFFYLKRNGYHVTVCGNVKEDPCHQYADSSLFIDYSIRERLFDAVKSADFNYIVPTCNDYSYISCAWTASQIKHSGFDGFDVTMILHQKDLFRAFMAKNGLPAPRCVTQHGSQKSRIDDLNFPLLVKPVDAFSGRGMSKINSIDELDGALQVAMRSSRSSNVIIEEYINGTLHSHSAFIRNSSIAFDFFADEFCTVYAYQVNCSNFPSVLPENIRAKVRAAISKLVSLLDLSDGLLHTQFLSDGHNIWIVECMRRCPGDLYGNLIRLATGVDYVEMYARPFLDCPLPADIDIDSTRFYGRHTISCNKPVVFDGFSSLLIDRKVDVIPLKCSGERLDPAPYDKLGILFVEYASFVEMQDLTPKLADFVEIKTFESLWI